MDGVKGLRVRARGPGRAEISDTSEPPSHTYYYTSRWFKVLDEGVLCPSDVNENNPHLLRLIVVSAQRLIRELAARKRSPNHVIWLHFTRELLYHAFLYPNSHQPNDFSRGSRS